jgi:hypothetical protein
MVVASTEEACFTHGLVLLSEFVVSAEKNDLGRV